MKAKIRAILEKYGIDNYHWKPEITEELAVLFKEAEAEKEVSDEDIEKWANEKLPYETGKWDNRISERLGLIEGAKAHRDNLIKKGE